MTSLTCPGTRSAREAGQRGSAAVLTVGVGLALTTVLCGTLPTAAGLALAGASARATADAVALAALAGSPLLGGDWQGTPDADASRVVDAAGAELRTLDLSGWPVTATATVAVRAPGALGRLLPPITATAAARVDPPPDGTPRPPPADGGGAATGP